MRVAVFVSELDVKGGTHKQVLRLCEYLVSRGHAVKLFTCSLDLSRTYPEFSAFTICAAPWTEALPWRRLLSWWAPVYLTFRMHRFDVLNIHDNRGIFFFFLASMLRRAERVVWQINDLDPAFRIGAHQDGQRSSFRDILRRAANRLMARSVDAITVNVGKNKERVQSCLHVPALVHHCGVDFPVSHVEPPSAPAGELKVLSTGVFFEYRNYETIVSACAIAQRRSDVPISLSIVGDTKYRPQYAARIRELASRANVKLSILENLPQDELDEVIARHHVFAFLNLDQSWGLAVFEAAARERPVILSRSVGATELLAGSPGIFVVDPLDADEIAAILSALQARNGFAEEGRRARRSVQGMSWNDLYCGPTERLFANLLATAQR